MTKLTKACVILAIVVFSGCGPQNRQDQTNRRLDRIHTDLEQLHRDLQQQRRP